MPRTGGGCFPRGVAGRVADESNRCGAGIGITAVKPREGGDKKRT